MIWTVRATSIAGCSGSKVSLASGASMLMRPPPAVALIGDAKRISTSPLTASIYQLVPAP